MSEPRGMLAGTKPRPGNPAPPGAAAEPEARVYADPEGFGPDAEHLLDEPLERTAVLLWLFSWHTPEDAAITLGQGKAWPLWAPDGSETQTRVRATDRHLYRRRAALVLFGEL